MTTIDPTATTAVAIAAPGRPRAWTIWIVTLAAGLLVGFGCFVYQWSEGLGVTGLSNTITWGLYIVAFMFLVGISAGGLIVVAGAELVGSHRFEHLNRLAVVCSVAAVATAAGTILPDLGRPERAWKMLVQPHVTSPLVWDMAVLGVYLAIGLIDLWILTRTPVPAKALRVMAIVSLPVAILVHSVTAWIFGLLVARPFWNTPLLAPLFISSALVSGTSLVIGTAYITGHVTTFRVGADVYVGLRRLLLWFVAADVFLLFTEVMTTYVSGEPDHRAQLDILLTGRLAPVFWSEVGLGMAVPRGAVAVPQRAPPRHDRRSRPPTRAGRLGEAHQHPLRRRVRTPRRPRPWHPRRATRPAVPTRRDLPPDMGRDRRLSRHDLVLPRHRHPRRASAPSSRTAAVPTTDDGQLLPGAVPAPARRRGLGRRSPRPTEVPALAETITPAVTSSASSICGRPSA